MCLNDYCVLIMRSEIIYQLAPNQIYLPAACWQIMDFSVCFDDSFEGTDYNADKL